MPGSSSFPSTISTEAEAAGSLWFPEQRYVWRSAFGTNGLTVELRILALWQRTVSGQPQYPPVNPFTQTAAATALPDGDRCRSDRTYLSPSGAGAPRRPAAHCAESVRQYFAGAEYAGTVGADQGTPGKNRRFARQVLIEAKIYEVDLTGSMSAGVEAFLEKQNGTNAAGLTQHQLTGSSLRRPGLTAGTMVDRPASCWPA